MSATIFFLCEPLVSCHRIILLGRNFQVTIIYCIKDADTASVACNSGDIVKHYAAKVFREWPKMAIYDKEEEKDRITTTNVLAELGRQIRTMAQNKKWVNHYCPY
jgi:hypothetical protein